ncbi:MAG: RNA-binding S4 domain-containing protein [Acidimicrobiales bacterium]
MTVASPVRVDKWLWSVRVYRTRTAAADACATGRVAVNDEPAKPATKVGPGDVVTARRRDRTIVYRVVDPIARRVSAELAATCIEDLSPPVELGSGVGDAALDGARERGTGRPTKRDRRALDRLKGRP